MNTLEFERRLRKQQSYFDFIVSGQSLKTLLKADSLDLISPFGWGDSDEERKVIKEFIGLERPRTPKGRLMIYVCPECGDIGCGCISADIEVTDDKVIWKNFGYENDYSDIDFDSYKGIRPIIFDKADYLTKFRRLG